MEVVSRLAFVQVLDLVKVADLIGLVDIYRSASGAMVEI